MGSFLRVEREGWISLTVGGALGAAAYSTSPFHFILSYLQTLVHEAGHCLCGLLFGYFSVPSFDLTHGGGYCILCERHWLPTSAVYAALAFLAWNRRRRACEPLLWISALILYAVLAHTSIHQALIDAMGHGAELLFAALCFYRVFSGQDTAHLLERSAYAMVGSFIVINCLMFAWDVLNDDACKTIYEQGLNKGGMEHDFVKLAKDHFSCPLENVFTAFLFISALPPLAGLALSWLRSRRLDS